MHKVGYKFNNAHIRLGSKIHLKDFYYAERIFENSFYARRFAYLVYKNLVKEEKLENAKEIYLVGYGVYSSMLVSLLKSFLKNSFSEIKFFNYGVNNTEDLDIINFSDVTSKPEETKGKSHKVVLVVPIGATLTTSSKILGKLSEEWGGGDSKKIEIIGIYTLIVVGENLKKLAGKTDLDLVPNKKIEISGDRDPLVAKYWKVVDIDKGEITTKQKFNGTLVKEKFFLYLDSEWQDAETCVHCFPQLDKKNNPDIKTALEKELPLFQTSKPSVVPETILGLPVEDPSLLGDEMSNRLKNVFDEAVDRNYILTGHFERNNKHYSYYFKSEKMFEDFTSGRILKNSGFKESYTNWTNRIKKEISKENDSNGNEKVNILLAPATDTNINFANSINELVFKNTGNIIRLHVKNDYRDNFNRFHEYLHNRNKYNIVFVDSDINTGASLDHIINHLETLISPGTHKKQPVIDHAIFFINRLSANKNIAYANRGIKVHSFLRFYIPVFRNSSKFCTLCKRRNELKSILRTIEKNSVIVDEIEKLKVKSLMNGNIKLLDERKNGGFLKIKYDSGKTEYSLKVGFQIAEFFTYIRKGENESFDVAKKRIEKNICQKWNTLSDYTEKQIFLEALSNPSLMLYYFIRKIVFKLLLHEFLEILFDSKDNSHDDISQFDFFVFLIRKLAELKSNVLLRKEVIEKVWEKYINYKEKFSSEEIAVKRIVDKIVSEIVKDKYIGADTSPNKKTLRNIIKEYLGNDKLETVEEANVLHNLINEVIPETNSVGEQTLFNSRYINKKIEYELKKILRSNIIALKDFLYNINHFKDIYILSVKEIICKEDGKSKRLEEELNVLRKLEKGEEFQGFINDLEAENTAVYFNALKNITVITPLINKLTKELIKIFGKETDNLDKLLEYLQEGVHKFLIDKEKFNINNRYFMKSFVSYVRKEKNGEKLIQETFDSNTGKYKNFVRILLLKVLLSKGFENSLRNLDKKNPSPDCDVEGIIEETIPNLVAYISKKIFAEIISNSAEQTSTDTLDSIEVFITMNDLFGEPIIVGGSKDNFNYLDFNESYFTYNLIKKGHKEVNEIKNSKDWSEYNIFIGNSTKKVEYKYILLIDNFLHNNDDVTKDFKLVITWLLEKNAKSKQSKFKEVRRFVAIIKRDIIEYFKQRSISLALAKRSVMSNKKDLRSIVFHHLLGMSYRTDLRILKEDVDDISINKVLKNNKLIYQIKTDFNSFYNVLKGMDGYLDAILQEPRPTEIKFDKFKKEINKTMEDFEKYFSKIKDVKIIKGRSDQASNGIVMVGSPDLLILKSVIFGILENAFNEEKGDATAVCWNIKVSGDGKAVELNFYNDGTTENIFEKEVDRKNSENSDKNYRRTSISLEKINFLPIYELAHIDPELLGISIAKYLLMKYLSASIHYDLTNGGPCLEKLNGKERKEFFTVKILLKYKN